MYFQPYGDDQQLNLNWIINEIINLHKQLDPDYETPSFTQVYPYSNLNRLNLDWILSELKALKELAPEPTPQLDIQAVAEALVALPFDSNTSYQIYDFISRDGEIWRATEAIPAGGEWDSTKWFKTKLGTDLPVLERWINTINNSLSGEIEARQSADTAIERTIANLNNAREDILDDCNNFILGVKKVAPQTLNMPESAYGFIESYTAQNGNWKWQFLTTTQTPQKIFKRAKIIDADWTAWVRIADNTDVESLQGSLNSILPFDTTPTSGSEKGITSGGVYSELANTPKLMQFTLTELKTLPTGSSVVTFTPPQNAPHILVKYIFMFAAWDNVYYQWNPQIGDLYMDSQNSWEFNINNSRGNSLNSNTFQAFVIY